MNDTHYYTEPEGLDSEDISTEATEVESDLNQLDSVLEANSHLIAICWNDHKGDLLDFAEVFKRLVEKACIEEAVTNLENYRSRP